MVHLGNGRLSGGAGAHTDEPKPTGSAGTTIAGEEDVGDGTEFAEDLAKAVLVGAYVAGIGVMSDKRMVGGKRRSSKKGTNLVEPWRRVANK